MYHRALLKLVNQSRFFPNFCYFSVSSSRNKNYYEILNVEPDCSQAEIKVAFLRKSKSLHPDTIMHDGLGSHEEFVVLNEAYSVLSKPDLRREYDLKFSSTIKKTTMNSAYNPYRSKDFKNPYAEFNEARQNTDRWSEYYSTYGHSRAKRRMQQSIHDEFWKKHWDFWRQTGGGGPQMPSHDQSSLNKKPALSGEMKFMVGAMLIIVLISAIIIVNSDRATTDMETINKEYVSWLVAKLDLPEEKEKPVRDVLTGQIIDKDDIGKNKNSILSLIKD